MNWHPRVTCFACPAPSHGYLYLRLSLPHMVYLTVEMSLNMHLIELFGAYPRRVYRHENHQWKIWHQRTLGTYATLARRNQLAHSGGVHFVCPLCPLSNHAPSFRRPMAEPKSAWTVDHNGRDKHGYALVNKSLF